MEKKIKTADAPTVLPSDAQFDSYPDGYTPLTVQEVIDHDDFIKHVDKILWEVAKMRREAKKQGLRLTSNVHVALSRKGVFDSAETVRYEARRIFTKTSELSHREREYLVRLFSVAGNKVCEEHLKQFVESKNVK